MVILLSNQQDVPIDEDLARTVAQHVLESENVAADVELSIAFVTEDEIRKLNRTYRGVDNSTDVLSFGMDEETSEDEAYLIGDVVICPEAARKQAEEFGHSFEAEIGLLLAHGILHLLGYDHQQSDQAEEMEKREQELLKPFFGGVFDS
ncbi:MAG: rRNA maturation RNase YbeY [Chloroflexi bacterium]|nr:rRNA maturation RNase YbeY [Chloroflexota bacterium]